MDVRLELYGEVDVIEWQDSGECPEADRLFDTLYFDKETNQLIDCESQLLGADQT